MMKRLGTITFPEFSGARCLMMPYIQGDPMSVPDTLAAYRPIIESSVIRRGDIGYLTIDESVATQGTPHRGARAKHGRALHTEAGRDPVQLWCWGGGSGYGWGSSKPTPPLSTPKPSPVPPPTKRAVTLDRDVTILLANSIDNTCAVWDAEQEDTSDDGDIGYLADLYPYETATILKAGEMVHIGILTPHESLPVRDTSPRQFVRIVSAGVHGREPYFTDNPLMEAR